MRKVFKYRLAPTKKQEHTLFWTLSLCRELYNAALQERRGAYESTSSGIQASMTPKHARGSPVN